MFLTTRGRYAVMAMLDMYSSYSESKIVSIKSMAARQSLSVYYLEQLFCLLKKEGIVKSIKGPGGGYIFEREPEKIFLSQILKAVGENIKITKCGTEDLNSCNNGENMKCNTHLLWVDLGEHINQYFTNTSLADISNKNFFFQRSLKENKTL